MGIFDLFDKPKVEKEFYENGKLKNEATYKSGKKNGPEKGYHENGNIHFECEWINGEQDGEITSYDEDGNKKKQSFLKKGSYDGPQKEWWPNGKLRAERIMKNNEIISEETYSQNGTVVVFEDKIEDIGIVSHYNGKPFTGIMFVDPYAPAKNFAVKYWWVNEQYEMVDGLKDGLKSEFYENGKIKMQTKFSKDEFINIIGYFDLKGNNLIETDTCLTYDKLEEKNDVYYHGGKPYNGSIIYSGGSISIFTDGITVSSKDYFLDGAIKTISEIVNGELIEIKGWIKIDADGNYHENGKKILVREYNDGVKKEYFDNEKIKKEVNMNTGSITEYYENGNIESIKVNEKSADMSNYQWHTAYKELKMFYENGELKGEKTLDKKYGSKYISYYEDKTIQEIQLNKVTFKFDENGIESKLLDSDLSKKEIKEKNILREYLNLKKPTSKNEAELYYNFRTTKISYKDEIGLVYGSVAVGAKTMSRVVIRASNKNFETNWMKLTETKVAEFFTDSNNKYMSWEDVMKLGFEIGSDSFSLCDNSDKEIKVSNKDFLEYIKANYSVDSNTIHLIDDGAPKINSGDKRQFIYENINFEYDYQKVAGLLEEPPYCENIKGNSKDVYEILCQYSKENAWEIIETLFPGKYTVDEDEYEEFEGFIKQ